MKPQKIYNIVMASAVGVIAIVLSFSLWMTATKLDKALTNQARQLKNSTDSMSWLSQKLAEAESNQQTVQEQLTSLSTQQKQDLLDAAPTIWDLAEYSELFNSYLQKIKQLYPKVDFESAKKVEVLKFTKDNLNGLIYQRLEKSDALPDNDYWIWSPDKTKALAVGVGCGDDSIQAEGYNLFGDKYYDWLTGQSGSSLCSYQSIMWLDDSQFIASESCPMDYVNGDQEAPWFYQLFYYNLANQTRIKYELNNLPTRINDCKRTSGRPFEYCGCLEMVH